jgi:hypothetical protein
MGGTRPVAPQPQPPGQRLDTEPLANVATSITPASRRSKGGAPSRRSGARDLSRTCGNHTPVESATPVREVIGNPCGQ